MAIVFQDTFVGTDGDPWNASKWTATPAEGDVVIFNFSGNGAGRLFINDSVSYGHSKALAVMSAEGDQEVELRYRRDTTGEQYFFVTLRGDGTWYNSGSHPSNGYFAEIQPNDNNVLLRRRDGSGVTTITTISSQTFTTGTWYRLRFRITGTGASTLLQFKKWTDGDTEPGTWTGEANDLTSGQIATGILQIAGATGSAGLTRSHYIDDVEVDNLVVPPTQYARPSADVTDGNWVKSTGGNTDLYTMLDEDPASDADYIESGDLTASEDVVELLLETVSDPTVDSDHVIRIRAAKDTTGGDTTNMHLSLVEGSTVIASTSDGDAGWPVSVTDTWTEYTWEIPSTEIDDLAGYSDLRIRIRGVKG